MTFAERVRKILDFFKPDRCPKCGAFKGQNDKCDQCIQDYQNDPDIAAP